MTTPSNTDTELVYNGCLTFKIMGEEINLSSEDLGNARSTVAEMEEYYHYLGNEPLVIASAIYAWQEANGRQLTSEELHRVMVDNHLSSDAV